MKIGSGRSRDPAFAALRFLQKALLRLARGHICSPASKIAGRWPWVETGGGTALQPAGLVLVTAPDLWRSLQCYWRSPSAEVVDLRAQEPLLAQALEPAAIHLWRRRSGETPGSTARGNASLEAQERSDTRPYRGLRCRSRRAQLRSSERSPAYRTRSGDASFRGLRSASRMAASPSETREARTLPSRCACVRGKARRDQKSSGGKLAWRVCRRSPRARSLCAGAVSLWAPTAAVSWEDHAFRGKLKGVTALRGPRKPENPVRGLRDSRGQYQLGYASRERLASYAQLRLARAVQHSAIGGHMKNPVRETYGFTGQAEMRP